MSRVQCQFAGDWEPGPMPENVLIDATAYVHSVYSFDLCRSERPEAITLARGSQVNDGTMFDLGPNARVHIGECALLTSVWFLCDAEITVGAYTMISWSVVLMDTYRVPVDPEGRRSELAAVSRRPWRKIGAPVPARPIHIGNDVWIGFECCVLPGVTIGNGAIVGARSVVVTDVEPYTVVAGNPARLVKRLVKPEGFA
ncbi:MAG TPA: acyltransferase [Candidatus Sulfotelmatobacter sp.]|nr:acyltransferase [Candidatus Sulfotelmatobacter sp.]